jgi:hypothetical protein
MASVLVLGGAAMLLWQYTRPSKPMAPSWTPWIGLPASGMDASSQNTREALFELEQIESSEREQIASYDTLIHRCGRDDGGSGEKDSTEIYVARMGDSYFTGARGWRVEFSVERDQITATISDATGGLLPPPPPPPGSKSPPPSQQPMPAPKVVWLTKAQLRPIADIWRDPKLWDAPQETVECVDGMPSILEACVHGHYAMRDLHCSSGSQQAFTLWKTMQRLLPPPDEAILKPRK